MKENMTQEEKRAAYYKTPQRLHVYESTDKAKEIVQKSMAIDTLFSGVVPIQWSTPQAPEFHDEMDKIKAAGFKTIGACTTADALGASFVETMKALELYLAKFHERPDKYQLVRTAADIDKAIAEDKLGIYFTHQGTDILEGDPERVSVLRQLGYGYCLLAYNSRNPVGDGAFEPDNGHLTIYGKAVIDAYNKYGMIVDVSHIPYSSRVRPVIASREF